MSLAQKYGGYAVGTAVVIAGIYKMGEFVYGRKQEMNEPIIIKGYNPIYGCSQYLNDDHAPFLKECINKYGDIFTLRLENNKYMTFIMDSKSFRNVLYHKNASWFHVAPRAWQRFGISKITTTPSNMKIFSGTLQEYIRHSHSIQTLLSKLQQTMSLVLNSKPINVKERKDWIYPKLSLYKWIKQVMFQIQCDVFFGDSFVDQELKMLYQQFDKSVPLRFAGNSQKPNGNSLNALLDKMAKMIDYYYGDCIDEMKENNDIPQMFKAAHSICSKLKASKRDECGILITLMWAATSNMTHGIYWMLIRILSNNECKEKIFDELSKFNITESCTNLNKLRNELPLLNSLIYEVFRFYGQSHLYRVATNNICLNVNNKEYKIRKGDWFGSNSQFLHRNEKYFKCGEQFIYDRFYEKDNIGELKQHLFVFGTMCPGKFFAEGMFMIIISFLLKNIKFECKNNNDYNKQFNVPKMGNYFAFSLPSVNSMDDLQFRFKFMDENQNKDVIMNDNEILAMYQNLVYGNNQLKNRYSGKFHSVTDNCIQIRARIK